MSENCPRCSQPRFTCACMPEELAQAAQSVPDEPTLSEPRPVPVRVFNKTTNKDDYFESWEAYLDGTKERRTACQHSFEVLNKFAYLFKGNPAAYALYDGKKYETIKRCDDWPSAWERHLRGEYPSLLSIPILPDGNCYFAALDIDRHEGCTLPPLNHAALATFHRKNKTL